MSWINCETATAHCPGKCEFLMCALVTRVSHKVSKMLETSLAQLNTEHVEVLVSLTTDNAVQPT